MNEAESELEKLKKELKNLRTLDRQINNYTRQRNKIIEDFQKVSTFDYDKVQTTVTNSSEEKMAKYIEYGERVDKAIDELIDLRDHWKARIDKIDDSRYRLVLYDYYINNSTWEQVAVNQNYGIQHVYKLHGQALLELLSILKKEESKCE